MKVLSENISVVIQGAILHNKISSVIESVYKNLPNAEIILSTWKGQGGVIAKQYADIILVESDPVSDSYQDPISGVYDNLHRQLITTQMGLSNASREYSLKMRSDLLIDSTDFFYIEEIDKKLGVNFLSKKITITNLGFTNPVKVPFLAHFSDLVMLGRTSDLRQYWTFVKDLNPVLDYYAFVKSKLFFNRSGLRCSRYACEQQIGINAISKNFGEYKLKHLDDFSFESAFESERFAVQSFNLLDYKKSGIKFPARIAESKFNNNFYQLEDFFEIEKYVVNKIVYRQRYREILNTKINKAFFSPLFYRGILAIVIRPIAIFARRLGVHWVTVIK